MECFCAVLQFALLYTVGNVLSALAIIVLMGPSKAFAFAQTPKRMFGLTMYFFSLSVTIYCVMWLHWSYFALPVIFGQVSTLTWFAGQFLPFSIPGCNFGMLRWLVCGMCSNAAKVATSVV